MGQPKQKKPDVEPPLCVDLDGTLIETDSFYESVICYLRRRPLGLLQMFFWLFGGRAFFKRCLAHRVNLDVRVLPYNQELLAYLKEEHRRGRSLVLATGTDSRVAGQIAEHVGLFSQVFASDGQKNLTGTRKADCLVHNFGEGNFDYIGNSSVDKAVWKRCRQPLVVGMGEEQAKKLVENGTLLVSRPPVGFQSVFGALRPHHWVKNLLIFAPLALAHRVSDLNLVWQAALACVAFSLCASGIYVFNDLLDIVADRQNVRNKSRSFASGELSLAFGFTLFPILLAVGLACGLLVSVHVTLFMGCYIALNVIYTIRLKRILFADVTMLAGFYALRIFVGAEATSVELSPWFLAFSVFLFLSLALVKRVSELVNAGGGQDGGRVYRPEDVTPLMVFGATSGYVAVLVLALYLNSDQVRSLYQYPTILWALCAVLLFWVSRLWILTYRGCVDCDPVVFALRDRATLFLAPTVLIIWCLAWGILTTS